MILRIRQTASLASRSRLNNAGNSGGIGIRPLSSSPLSSQNNEGGTILSSERRNNLGILSTCPHRPNSTISQMQWKSTIGNVMAGNSQYFSTKTSSSSSSNNDDDNEQQEEKNTKEDTNTTTTPKEEEKKEKKSLHDTIHKLKNDDTDPNNNTSSDDDLLYKLSSTFDKFKTEVGNTWTELLESSKPKDVNKKMSDVRRSAPGRASDDDDEAADRYVGSTAIMVIDEEEHMTAYERIQKRLSEAPIIQAAIHKSEQIYETSGAKKIKQKATHITEDAREAWETSQNPWVYRASSIYDEITSESEQAMAERILQELDPEFSLDKWMIDLEEVTLPKMMGLFLEGRIKDLKPYLGESVYNRMAAEARVRKKEGTYIDTNVLMVMNTMLLGCMPDPVNKGSAPIITLHFNCQQINCTRKKETDEIVEGSEDDIRAYSYVAAFQREYDEELDELKWRIIDFMPNGAIAYI